MKFRFSLALLLLTPLTGFAQQLTATSAKGSPVYTINEPVIWDLKLSGDGADAVKELRYTIKRNGASVLGTGTLPLENGAAKLESKLDQAGTLLVEFNFNKADGTVVKSFAGAAIEPDKIEPSKPEPADFQSFWKSKLEELAKVPQNPVLTPEASEVEGVDYSKLTLDNIRGTKVRGQITRPTTGEKFPAMLRLQYAGVYGLPKSNVTSYAKNGWLVLNINAHDLPIDQTPEFYKEQSNGVLKGYTTIGETDKETSYFLRMLLSCQRAVEYLKTRPDWDGKTIVAEGASQGGFQSLAIAGLNPSISAVVVNVPAGVDNTSGTADRATPWPGWFWRAKDKPEVLETSRYFDALNFARHIKVPTLIAVGLVDTTSTPTGVIAAYNQIQSPDKKLIIMERSGHQNEGGTQAAYYKNSWAWIKALQKEETLPPILAG